MIGIICWVVLSTHVAEAQTGLCDKMNTAQQKLKWAEAMIKSAKQDMPGKSFPMDCEEVLKNGDRSSGVYQVWPKSRLFSGPISVYCDMETDGGGWTVIQRRGNYGQSADFFYKDWNSYKEGFGDLKKDFWLGNDKIFALSNQKMYSIRLDLTPFNSITMHALYDTFWIEEEHGNYRLHVSGYSGNAGDWFSRHNEYNFTTRDRNNCIRQGTNCAQLLRGAWWFSSTSGLGSHLNGIYHSTKDAKFGEGLMWREWDQSLNATEMKIREFAPWTSDGGTSGTSWDK